MIRGLTIPTLILILVTQRVKCTMPEYFITDNGLQSGLWILNYLMILYLYGGLYVVKTNHMYSFLEEANYIFLKVRNFIQRTKSNTIFRFLKNSKGKI